MNLANHVVIYGNHYATPDGTAVRDYVSLEDVVQANVLAVEYMLCKCDSIVCNIGSGIGTSNLEVVHAVEKQFRKKIPVVFASPRKESIYSVADIHKARQILGWEPTHSDIPSLIKNFGYTATP
jgi:UDP-glucose 4-epimerase